MTNAETLEKAITKAITGGWNPKWGQPDTPRLQDCKNDFLATSDIGKGTQYDSDITIYWRSKGSLLYHSSTYWVIYNHDFAKALWGEEVWEHMYLPHLKKFAWQHHLQQMVIAEDPIAYLGANI